MRLVRLALAQLHLLCDGHGECDGLFRVDFGNRLICGLGDHDLLLRDDFESPLVRIFLVLHAFPLGCFGGILYHLRQIKIGSKNNPKIDVKSSSKYDILRARLKGLN